MKPIRKMRLFAAALAVACLLAATVRTVAAGRGKAVLTGVVYGDGAPLAGVCVSDGVQFATTDAASRFSGRRSTRRMPVTNSTTSILQASISRATR